MPEQNPIDQLFKERLQGHEMQPSAAVWQKVAAAQKTSSAKSSPLFLLRAAAIALLIGLSAVVQFSGNQSGIKGYQPLSVQETGTNPNTGATAKAPSATEPKKESPKQGTKKETAPKAKSAKAPLPVLRQPTTAGQIFVRNPIPVVNEQALHEEQDENRTNSLTNVKLAVADELPDYSVTIRSLPETKGYYGPDTNAVNEPKFSEKLMAYASTQMNRLLAGEKPQLPKTNKKPELAITIPKFLNK